jgi:hypothetical protein
MDRVYGSCCGAAVLGSGGHRDSSKRERERERERRSLGFSPMALLGGRAAEMAS